MANFHLDQNVSSQIGVGLESLGHTVVTAYALGMGEADDEEHLLVPAHHRRIVVTYNRKDFILLHHAWLRWQEHWQIEHLHSGILIVPDKRPIFPYVQAIDTLSQERYGGFDNQLYEWRNGAWGEHPLHSTFMLPKGDTTDG